MPMVRALKHNRYQRVLDERERRMRLEKGGDAF